MADKDFKVKAGLDLGSPLPIAEGGTGQTTANNALNALLPVQTSASGKILESDGTSVSWVTKPSGYTRGTVDARPASGTIGDLYYNTTNQEFQVWTGNAWSAVSAPAAKVTNVVATNPSGSSYNNARASVAFTYPTSGGYPTSFVATSSPGNITGSGTSSPIIISGLTAGTSYTFTVTGTNSYGSSTSDASSSGSFTTVPQAPTIGTATPAPNEASVTFTAGATGGSTITGYTVTSSPGNITATGSSSPIVVSGLTNGTAYTFTVTATNANGTSAASSATTSVTPVGVTLFTSSGTFTPSSYPTNYTVYVVGGGGGWGGNYGNGSSGLNGYGGAGGSGYYTKSTGTLSSGSLSVVIGGAGSQGSSGTASSFGAVTANGGGNGVISGSWGGSGGHGGSGGGAGFGGYYGSTKNPGFQYGVGPGGCGFNGGSGQPPLYNGTYGIYSGEGGYGQAPGATWGAGTDPNIPPGGGSGKPAYSGISIGGVYYGANRGKGRNYDGSDGFGGFVLVTY